MVKDSKDYYEYGTVIKRLRPLYIDLFKNIRELMKHVYVVTNEAYSSDVSFRMREGKDVLSEAIVLNLTRNPNSLRTKMDDLAYNYFCGDERYMVQNHAKYVLSMQDLEFYHASSTKFEGQYCPEVLLVSSDEDAQKALKRIKTNELFNLSTVRAHLNPLQFLDITGSGISLSTVYGEKRLVLSYAAGIDRVKIDANHAYFLLPHNLLETKIAKYELPDEYNALLEKSEDLTKLIIADDISARKETFAFEENTKGLVLVRDDAKNKR